MKEFVYILPGSDGGVTSVVRNLLRYTAHPEVRKKVITLRYGRQEDVDDIPRFDCDEQINILFTDRDSRHSICRRIARHISPESIIISNDGSHEISTLELFRLDNPLIYITHGCFDHYFNAIRGHLNSISAVITVSSYLAEQVKKRTGFPSPQTIFFGTPEISQSSIEKPTAPITITYAGILNTHKNCHLFSKLVELLQDANIDFLFNIIGTGELSDLLHDELGNNPRVKLWGQLPNNKVIEVYRQSHISLLLSKSEGLPVSIVESMKSGALPLVFSIDSGIPDIVEDGINGFIVPQGDLNSVADCISHLASDRALLRRLSETAIVDANAKFEPYRQTALYESAFLIAPHLHRALPLRQRFLSRIPTFLSSPLLRLLH